MPRVSLEVNGMTAHCTMSQVAQVAAELKAVASRPTLVSQKVEPQCTAKALIGQQISDFADTMRVKISQSQPHLKVRTLHQAQCVLRKADLDGFKEMSKEFSMLAAARCLLEHWDCSFAEQLEKSITAILDKAGTGLCMSDDDSDSSALGGSSVDSNLLKADLLEENGSMSDLEEENVHVCNSDDNGNNLAENM